LTNINKGKEADARIVITSTLCEYRLVQTKEWKKVDVTEIEDHFTLLPMISTEVRFAFILKMIQKQESVGTTKLGSEDISQ